MMAILLCLGMAPAAHPATASAAPPPAADVHRSPDVTAMSPEPETMSRSRDVWKPRVMAVRMNGAAAVPRLDTQRDSQAVTIRIHVSDTGSGTVGVSALVTSPTGSQSRVEATLISGSPADGWWRARLVLPSRSPRGIHRVSVEAIDAGGLVTLLHPGDDGFLRTSRSVVGPGVVRQIGVGDALAPQVTAVDVSDTSISTFRSAAEITITTDVTDSDAGVADVSIIVSGPDCVSCFLPDMTEQTSGDGTSGRWQRIITFPVGSPRGSYRVSISARDQAGNSVTIASVTTGDLRSRGTVIGPSTIMQRGDGRVIEGYPVLLDGENVIGRATSVAPGDTIGFALSTGTEPPTSVDLRITDARGRLMATLTSVDVPQQVESNTPWLSGQGFEIVTRFTIPHHWESGVYMLRDDPAMSFVVRPDAAQLDSGNDKDRVGVLVSTNTFNAYSITAGWSLYAHPYPTTVVSFLRYLNQVKEREWLPLIEYLSTHHSTRDLPLIMLSDLDLQTSDYLERLDTLVIVGHSEYWTQRARDNVDRFIDVGGNIIVASGNTMWWRSRYSSNGRQLVVAKDPGGNRTWSSLWTELDPRLSAVRTLGGDFNRGGFGVARRPEADGWGGYLICQPDNPIFSGTGLEFGDVLPLFNATEYDGPPILGFDVNGCPIPDASAVDAVGFEILGFDLGYRQRVEVTTYTMGGITLVKRSPTSGTVVHFATKDFGTTLSAADEAPFTRAARQIRRILSNTIDLLHRDALSVAPPPAAPPVTTPFTTPSTTPLPRDFRWIVHRPPHDQNPRFTGTG